MNRYFGRARRWSTGLLAASLGVIATVSGCGGSDDNGNDGTAAALAVIHVEEPSVLKALSDNPIGPTVAFESTGYVTDEKSPWNVSRQLKVIRGGSSVGEISVQVRVRAGGTAAVFYDYVFAADPGAELVTLHWADGDASPKYVVLRIVDDDLPENVLGEGALFELAKAVGAEIVDGAHRSQMWIYDDDFETAPVLIKARNHDIVYYVSKPHGWNASRNWPVVYVINGDNSWYRGIEWEFRTARGLRDFIVVTPITLSNRIFFPGPSEYYREPLHGLAWSQRRFWDEQGLLAIHADIQRDFRGEERFYLTGHSAGGVLNYQMIFHHPNEMAAAAPTCAQFFRSSITLFPEGGRELPIRAYQGGQDPQFELFENRWQAAKQLLVEKGFFNVERVLDPLALHVSFAPEVMQFFEEVQQARR